MRRRKFVGLIGGAVAWPIVLPAQSLTPVIGFLNSRSPAEAAGDLAGFRRGLAETGYVEGRNVSIEYRWAENRYERLPTLAADLVGRRVDVIAALGGPVTGLAVKAATTNIPFVFVTGVDPVKLGLVPSYAHLGGNATGVNMFITAVEAKRLGLLNELIPAAINIGVLVNSNSPEGSTQLNDIYSAAQAVGKQLQVVRAGSAVEIEAAFTTVAGLRVQALLVAADPSFTSQRDHIVALASRLAVPTVYESRLFALAGGLMSYGPNIADIYRQVGVYTGQILKGAKPADLPIIQPTALELVINLKTAKTIGLEIPPLLLARADEVIE